jgi:2',3'-cyclic-nucleotide 2'-phosphodiesterase (5'-nucleotidase family)
MQAKASKMSLLILVTFFMGACASSSTFRWPEGNPFAEAPAQNLSQTSEGRLPFRLVFVSNVMGEVEPCGCAVGPKGGLDRRLNFIRDKVLAEEKKWPFLIVDAGNSILPSPSIDEARVESYKKVALELLKASRHMGVAVQNVAYLDLGFGVDFLKAAAAQAGLPLVSASWIDAKGQLLFETHRDFVVGSVGVSVTGLSAGYEGARSDLGLSVRDAEKALGEVLNKIPKGNLVVVLSDLGQPKDEELAAKFQSRSMVFVGSRDLGGLSLPKQAGNSVMLQAQFRGQQWGVMDSYVKPSSEGWVLMDRMPYFADLWSKIVARRKMDQERLKDSRELKIEEQRHALAAQALYAYAPVNMDKKSTYTYRLEDLGDEYRKSNALTAVMTQLIRLKQ